MRDVAALTRPCGRARQGRGPAIAQIAAVAVLATDRNNIGHAERGCSGDMDVSGTSAAPVPARTDKVEDV